jgi:hypothetical protein
MRSVSVCGEQRALRPGQTARLRSGQPAVSGWATAVGLPAGRSAAQATLLVSGCLWAVPGARGRGSQAPIHRKGALPDAPHLARLDSTVGLATRRDWAALERPGRSATQIAWSKWPNMVANAVCNYC